MSDVLIAEFRRQFPAAFDRDLLGGEPPSSTVLNFFAQLRVEPEPDDGSSADEGGLQAKTHGGRDKENRCKSVSHTQRVNTETVRL